MNILKKYNIYITVFISDLLSDFGDTLYYLALMNYVLLVPNHQFAISIVTLSESVPVLFKITLGHLADKTTKKVNVIILTQVLRFILYLIAGFVLAFSPSLWIILIISILNLLSDLIGQYENGLYLPIEIQLIDEKDREKIFSSTQSISSIANIIFKLSGVILIAWISYQALAFINAFTFLICALIMLLIRSKLQTVSNKIDQAIEKKEGLKESSRLALKEILSIPLLKNFLVIIMVINGLFSIITPLTVTMISQQQQFVIINSATTISLISTILIISSIIGNIGGATILKDKSLQSCITVSTLFLPLLFLSFLLQNIWLYSFILFSLGFLSGAINPKFYAFILKNLSQEKIGILTGSIGTIFQIGTLLIQFSFSILILIISLKNIISLYLFLSIILLTTTLKTRITN